MSTEFRDEFRNSYLLPLPSDPFADVAVDDIFCYENPAADLDRMADSSASVYCLAEDFAPQVPWPSHTFSIYRS